jgi:hypothetical protein
MVLQSPKRAFDTGYNITIMHYLISSPPQFGWRQHVTEDVLGVLDLKRLTPSNDDDTPDPQNSNPR